jgi:hypothetical protein
MSAEAGEIVTFQLVNEASAFIDRVIESHGWNAEPPIRFQLPLNPSLVIFPELHDLRAGLGVTMHTNRSISLLKALTEDCEQRGIRLSEDRSPPYDALVPFYSDKAPHYGRPDGCYFRGVLSAIEENTGRRGRIYVSPLLARLNLVPSS